MTFIISGISNAKPFLMADCVGTIKKDDAKTYVYINKIYRLISTECETYFCLTGTDSYSQAINLFDRKCYEQKIVFDIKNEKHIHEILEIFEYIKSYYENCNHEVNSFCRLYFIDSKMIHYYDIEKDGTLSQIKYLKDGFYLEPDDSRSEPKSLDKDIINNEAILNYCKEYLKQVQDYEIDLKNRFSFVLFDKSKVLFNNSIKNNKELVLSETGGKYEDLEEA